jgi:hypothetical protein
MKALNKTTTITVAALGLAGALAAKRPSISISEGSRPLDKAAPATKSTPTPGEELDRLIGVLSNRMVSLPKGYRTFHPHELSDLARTAKLRLSGAGTNTRWADLEVQDAKRTLFNNLAGKIAAGEAEFTAAPKAPRNHPAIQSETLINLYRTFTNSQVQGTFLERNRAESVYKSALEQQINHNRWTTAALLVGVVGVLAWKLYIRLASLISRGYKALIDRLFAFLGD